MESLRHLLGAEGGLFSSLRDDGEIMQIFHQLVIAFPRQNHLIILFSTSADSTNFYHSHGAPHPTEFMHSLSETHPLVMAKPCF